MPWVHLRSGWCAVKFGHFTIFWKILHQKPPAGQVSHIKYNIMQIVPINPWTCFKCIQLNEWQSCWEQHMMQAAVYRLTRCHLDTALWRIIDSCLRSPCIMSDMSDCSPGQVSPCTWGRVRPCMTHKLPLLPVLTRCHGCHWVGAGWADTADNFTFRLSQCPPVCSSWVFWPADHCTLVYKPNLT